MMTSLLEYLDKDWEITVFPHPKAPGIAVVPPWTQLHRTEEKKHIFKKNKLVAIKSIAS